MKIAIYKSNDTKKIDTIRGGGDKTYAKLVM
jgi:hypothetical protein